MATNTVQSLIPPDQQERCDVLDSTASFIVQAPAGSGKTSLLIQRYLVLLGQVEKPENILAITFTRKAAEEMRDRLIGALQKAQRTRETPPEDDYSRKNWELAQKVLQRDREKGWNLLMTKERLRIKTIDSLCLYLINRLPTGSQFGSQLSPSDDCDPLYERAISDMIKAIDSSPEDSDIVKVYRDMLRFHDNDKAALTESLSVSLKNRALWMDHKQQLLNLNSTENCQAQRSALNRDLTQAIRAHFIPQLQNIASFFANNGLQEDLLEAMFYSLEHIDPTATNSASLAKKLQSGLRSVEGTWPAPELKNIDFYRAVRAINVNSDGDVRKTSTKSINKREGFPDKNAPERQKLTGILDGYRAELQQLFDDATVLTTELPPDSGHDEAYSYSDSQFTYMQASSFLLTIACEFLRHVFQEHHTCDHTEIALDALNALRSDNASNELALQLDSDIRHIMVDEYQDTSQSQLKLLESLTANWNSNDPDDERTIFMVGDPMQSIYRFRQADVGIYLRTRDKGLPNVKPISKVLSTNFRSQDGLIDWFNTCFSSIFPAHDNLSTSAIEYASATSPRSISASNAEPSTEFHIHLAPQPEIMAGTEAEYVVDLVQKELQREPADPDKSERVAILVNKRKEANYIIPLLRRAGIPYQAHDLEKLVSSAAVSDLLSLTKALLHLGDRLSWLALLRSPLVGLNDNEITRLAESDLSGTIWEIISAPDFFSSSIWEGLEEQRRLDISARCRHFLEVMGQSLAVRYQQPLSRWVEGTWLALGGPRTLTDIHESGLVKEYFTYLEEQEQKGIPDSAELERTLSERRAVPNNYPAGVNPVQLMTMHGSKGLEFDTVILPYLEGKPNPFTSGLFHSAEVPLSESANAVIFAVKADSNKYQAYENSPGYDEDNPETEIEANQILYGDIKGQSDLNERRRLLYVAATRAKKRLHLVGFTVHDSKGKAKFSSSSMGGLLAKLPDVCPVSELLQSISISQRDNATITALNESAESEPIPVLPIRRLKEEAFADLIPSPKIALLPRPDSNMIEEAEYGVAFHMLMQLIAERSIPFAELKDSDELLEEALGSIPPSEDNKDIVQHMRSDLQAILDDAQGRWSIEPHDRSSCEQEVIMPSEQGTSTYRLDRIFFGDDGKFWIVDYKTGHQHGKSSPHEYHEKMELYAKLMAEAKGLSEVHLALVYVNASRSPEYGGPVFVERGYWTPEATSWEKP